MASQLLKVALVQQMCGADPQHNLQESIRGIHEAHAQGAKLVLLPELHRTPYFCQSENPEFFALAEPIPGPSCQLLSALAAKLQIVIVASLFEARAKGLYHNTAVVFDTDGSLAGRYRKMHIPDDPGYYEKYYFTPGDLGFRPIQTSIGNLGVLVCWDQWFPESARLQALAGADLLLFPTAIGWTPSDDSSEKKRQTDAWITIQRSHAIANHLPVMACNRVGFEASPLGASEDASGIEFWGHSFICGGQGEMLATSTESAAVLVTTLDLDKTQTLRQQWPYLRDRRIDAYSGLLQRYLELSS